MVSTAKKVKAIKNTYGDNLGTDEGEGSLGHDRPPSQKATLGP